MERNFSIGEVAALLGVSKDTLRIYEEKGLFTLERTENGFRKYSLDDIYRLITILFYRSSSLSIHEVSDLLREPNVQKKQALIEQKIVQEQQEIFTHERNLRRLSIARNYFAASALSGSHCELSQMPEFLVLSDARTDLSETMFDWFHFAQNSHDLMLCYLNGEYQIENGFSAPTACYLVLSLDELNSIRTVSTPIQNPQAIQESSHYDTLSVKKTIGGCPALYTIELANNPLPNTAQLQSLTDEAARRGIKLRGDIHSHFLWRSEHADTVSYAIQLFAPVL